MIGIVRKLKWVGFTVPVLGSSVPNGFFFRAVDLDSKRWRDSCCLIGGYVGRWCMHCSRGKVC